MTTLKVFLTGNEVMKLDNYTKTVLSVIMFALVILIFQNALEMKKANAQRVSDSGGQKVQICVEYKKHGWVCGVGGSFPFRVTMDKAP